MSLCSRTALSKELNFLRDSSPPGFEDRFESGWEIVMEIFKGSKGPLQDIKCVMGVQRVQHSGIALCLPLPTSRSRINVQSN